MLAATPADLAERSTAIRESTVLARLKERLRGLLDPLLQRPVYVPDQKALLSRDGGVCPRDGARLIFDPFSPTVHRCPRCGESFSGERHHRAWIMRYHIWLSERAIHLALLGRLHGDPALAHRALEILGAYAARYPDYPNRDNVLGPTRLFFSTYLESIWLCQIVIAASLLEPESDPAARAVLEQIRSVVDESARLVASFDEGWSNRQVWNNAALIATGRWLGADDLVSRGLDGPHGIRAQLGHAVSADGLWFEGENYHFFAARGMLLAAEMLRRGVVDLYTDPATREPLTALYTAPLKSLLPDLTLPARSDSPYGVSVLQPRFAEFWEIGRARTGSEQLAALLAHLYAADAPEGEDSGLVELAEQEQNRPPARLLRERLGWKALLWMDPSEPAGGDWRPRSVLLADHGLAVLRAADRYVGLECGGRPGGHGHPDLLHLTLFWTVPWLVDPGTGSYVSRSLHWYRSTLAHNAPGVVGAGQLARGGFCTAFHEGDGWAWCRAQADDVFGEGSRAVRTLVTGPDYVVDVLEVDVPHGVRVDFALHPLGAIELPAGLERGHADLAVPGLAGHEHGYDAVLQAARLLGRPERLSARSGNEELSVWLVPRTEERLYLANAVGPPGLDFAEGPPTDFLVRRAPGSGTWVQLYARRPAVVQEVQVDGAQIRIRRSAKHTDVIDLKGREARVTTGTGSKVILRGARERPDHVRIESPAAPRFGGPILAQAPSLDGWENTLPPAVFHQLGAAEHRRAEEPYVASEFGARVAVFGAGRWLCFAIDVTKPVLVVRPPDAPDPGLDNEPPDIHSDGVQLYVGHQGWQGFVLVPDLHSSQVYIRAVRGTAAEAARLVATWGRTASGYRMLIRFDTGRRLTRGDQFEVNLVVNQMLPGRERRAGQLALAGGGGWVYLRGDRESPDQALVVTLA